MKVKLTMTQTGDELPRPQNDEEPDLLAESRSLQRKLVFWRRAAWLLLGLAVIVAVVFWQREEMHRRACADALAFYGKLAVDTRIEDQSDKILLEAAWQGLNKLPGAEGKPGSPRHYSLIADNWRRMPREGESLPLAVCNYPHLGLVGKGRHVLYRDARGLRVEWLSEELAAPIAAVARGEPRK